MSKTLLAVLVCTAALFSMPLFSQSQDAIVPSVSTIASPSRGETIYVPIYSSILYEDSKHTLELAATLSIHNVDPEHTLTVTQADYYDTTGKKIEAYLEQPLVLKPLETKHLLIEKTNTAGGLGANFLVEWRADRDVSGPLVEALMVNASHNLGIAFTSQGKVIRRVAARP